jgi:hypothetical protein
MTTLTPTQLQQQFEGSRLAVAAYAAADIKTLLNTNPSTHQLSAGLHNALLKQGFSIEQANNFVQKYSPVAALDQDGAGAVLFRVNGTDQVATAVRGTDWKENFRNDVVFADATIAQGQLPVYQTTLIANFVLRETTPAGQPVPQFSVQGGNSNAADLLRASSDSATTNQLMTAGGGLNTSLLSSPQITLPKIIQTGTTLGTGRAVGPCVDAAAHSEGGPEVTVVGSAIAQCARITTVNGPGVSLVQMQHVANEITSKANLPAQDLASQNQINSQLNVGTTGMSVIDGLNGGLPGTNTTLGIPTSFGGLVGSHSSIVAMNAAEAAYRDAGGVLNPGSGNQSDTYNFPDTAGAGRGVVNPSGVTPPTTVFNASTALPSYSGDNAVTIQPGDTVASIAKRYDMTVQEFSVYLKDQYGPNADLNSIVAGHKLPLPPAVYERTVGGINGLDLPVDTAPALTGATPTTTPETSDFQDALLDAFSNADQAAADLKAQYPGVQVADASGALPNTAALANTNTFSHFIDAQGSNLTSKQQDALASQIDKLGEAFGAAGNNQPGDLGAAAGYQQLAQGLQSEGGKFTEKVLFFGAANDEFLKRVA